MLQIKHAIQILNKLKITSNYAQGISTYINAIISMLSYQL